MEIVLYILIILVLSAYLQSSNLLVKYMILSVIVVIVKTEYEKCCSCYSQLLLCKSHTCVDHVVY